MSRPLAVTLLVLFVTLLSTGCQSVEEERRERIEKARFYLAEGEQAFRLEKYPEAIEAFDSAIEVHPDGYARAYFMRANARRRMGETDDAIEDYTRALALEPSYDRARFNRAGLFSQRGNWKAALRDLQAYQQSNPSDQKALLHIGALLYEHAPTRRQEALEFLQNYLKLAGRDENVERMIREIERELAQPPPP